MAAVQKLYEACKISLTSAATATAAPSPLVVRKICHILDGITCPDVGLSEESVNQLNRGLGFFGGQRGRHSSMAARWAPPISYLHLHESSTFSMGIFCLPTSSAIPLHDHPGMTVFSRLLYGTLHVRSYDWVDKQPCSDPSKPRLAKLVLDQVMTGPCDSVVLYPNSGGNIHAFTAINSCAILDVLAPPYCPSTGRHCTYYRAFPYSSLAAEMHDDNNDYDDENYVYLVEYKPPDDFVVQNGVYTGPKVKP
ncbi:plant cysteine oxidase 3 [Selaginella moellendorffii]|nr:plant cysteine oxidase 3 [Selaginella moellendorffii]|eukprot:XP_002974522.2 plant cysteine oxidase 3 [Selaginella moellendorffii]